MKRRNLLQSIVAVPALAAIRPAERAEQAGAQNNGPVLAGPPVIPPGETETPTVPVIPADQSSDAQADTFTAEEMRAFRRLAGLLIPPFNGMPGAIETEAPEFLAFLIGSSSREKLDLYRNGFDLLNRYSRERFHIEFAGTTREQADQLLAPLREPWDFHAATGKDFRAFLLAAKRDLLRATVNSRIYIDAVSQVRRPRNATRYYWFAID